MLFAAGILKFFVGTKLGRILVASAAALVALWIYGAWEHHRGYQECKVEWVAAEQATQKLGADARGRADRDVSGGMPDKFDRNDN